MLVDFGGRSKYEKKKKLMFAWKLQADAVPRKNVPLLFEYLGFEQD